MLRASSLGLISQQQAPYFFQRCIFLQRPNRPILLMLSSAPQILIVRSFRASNFSSSKSNALLNIPPTPSGIARTPEKQMVEDGPITEGSSSSTLHESHRPTFTLPPALRKRPSFVFGFQNRRSFRAKGLSSVEGFERVTHLSNRPKNCVSTPNGVLSYHLRIKQIRVPSLWTPSNDLESARRSWLQILGTTQNVDEAWDAYTVLLDHPLEYEPLDESRIFPRLLSRLVRLLSRQRPMTHQWYLRLLAVLTRLRSTGVVLKQKQWNVLIYAAGQGLRRTTVSHYEASLSYFLDMTKGRAPGTTLKLGLGVSGRDVDLKCSGDRCEPVKPDIYTYTTLLSIAAKTGDRHCVHHAKMLLNHSNIPPNRIAYLAMMKYTMLAEGPAGIHSTLFKLEEHNWKLGIDGLNACILAFSYSHRHDVITMIYRLLRHNVKPEPIDTQKDLENIRRGLRRDESLVIPPDLRPNEITYTAVIQTMAYHGYFTPMLEAFVDMLSTLNTQRGAPFVRDAKGNFQPTQYQPTITTFRAIFLGFRRHAIEPREAERSLSRTAATKKRRPTSGWTLENLKKLFDSFMALQTTFVISPSIFFWIIIAFRKASGNDVVLLREVWVQIEERYTMPWNSPNNRLQKLKNELFPGRNL